MIFRWASRVPSSGVFLFFTSFESVSIWKAWEFSSEPEIFFMDFCEASRQVGLRGKLRRLDFNRLFSRFSDQRLIGVSIKWKKIHGSVCTTWKLFEDFWFGEGLMKCSHFFERKIPRFDFPDIWFEWDDITWKFSYFLKTWQTYGDGNEINFKHTQTFRNL